MSPEATDPKQKTEVQLGAKDHTGNYADAPEHPFKRSRKPLDEVAGKLKTPESTKDLKGNRRLWIIVGGAAAGAALAVGGFLAINANNQPEQPTTSGQEGPENPGPVVEEPDTEVEPDTGGEVVVPPLDPTERQSELVEFNLFAGLSPEQQARISGMNNQDVATFRAEESRSDQLAFGNFVVQNNIDIARYRLSQHGNEAFATIQDPTSPEGIYQQIQLNEVVLSTMKKTGPDGTGVYFDTETALKASSILRSNEDDNAVAATDEFVNAWNVNTTTEITYKPYTIHETKVLSNGDIAYITSRNETPDRLVFTILTPEEYTDAWGEDATQYTRSLGVTAEDPRFRDSLENLN